MGDFLSFNLETFLSFMDSPSSSSSKPFAIDSFQPCSSISYNVFTMSGKEWKIVNTLGKGSYGTVHLAKQVDACDSHNNFIAVKSSLLRESSSLRKEIRLLYQFQKCPEIVRCYGEYLSTNVNGQHQYNLLLEYAQGGDLSHLISIHGGQIPEPFVRIYVGMLLKGLKFIHANGYVHCDLKPENILVFPSFDSIRKLKIADFGLVKEPDREDDDGDFISAFPGTPRYMSPESIFSEKISSALDIWSLGCVMIEMLTGEMPWNTCQNMSSLINDLIYSNKTPKIPTDISQSGKDFLNKIFVRRHQDRWSASMHLTHPFIVGKHLRSPLISDHPSSSFVSTSTSRYVTLEEEN